MLGSFEIDHLHTEGFVDLGTIGIGISTGELAAQLGTVENIDGIAAVQTLTPKQADESTPNTYSGQYGLGVFPLHTDLAHWYLPPRYFLLRCIVPSRAVFTSIVHKRDAISTLPRSCVRRAMFTRRRKLGEHLSLLRFEQGDLIRWDSKFLVPANDEARNVSDHIEAVNQNRNFGTQILLREVGQSVIIDNWNTLHARSAIEPGAARRVIERVYLGELIH